MKILGLSAFYHDSAAALIVDGEIMAAAQEERFTRLKHDSNFPTHAALFCLGSTGLSLDEIDFIVFYEKPFLKFERLMETYLNEAPKGLRSFQKAFPLWIKEKLFQKKLILEYLQEINPQFQATDKILFNEHHMSHAASAFYPSPFERAAVVTLDGVGEWATTTVGEGNGSQLNLVKEIHFPHSLGLFYSAFTYFCGFRVNSGEYKLMGLAPYGNPVFKERILAEIIKLHKDGSFQLNMDFFDYNSGLKMTHTNLNHLFGIGPKKADRPLEPIHLDIAASAQAALEEAILNLINSVDASSKNLCLAGGVALNCVANTKIKEKSAFDNIWVQPAAGDAGGALGAALSVWHQHLDQPRPLRKVRDSMKGAQLGPRFSQEEVELQLNSAQAIYSLHPQEEILQLTADSLVSGKAVGWFQGPMEFGPRSLGHRSILADPRRLDMQKNLNLKIKFRESFRPFAPAVLQEKASDWFDLIDDSPYMLFTAPLKQKRRTQAEERFRGLEKLHQKRSEVPAITHVDFSARLQTVTEKHNPLFYKLISKFYEKTDCPMLINTSFNVRGEPIVCTPTDAFRCFMGTDLDILVIGSCFLQKEKQMAPGHNHARDFLLD